MAGFKKKFVGIALAGALAVGSVAVVSAPASAANFGGYITHCSGSKKVTSEGGKLLGLPIVVTAPGVRIADSTQWRGSVKARSYTNSGTWTVTGSGARSGNGYCS